MAFRRVSSLGSDFTILSTSLNDEEIAPVNNNSAKSRSSRPTSPHAINREEHSAAVSFASARILPHLFVLCARHGAAHRCRALLD